MGETFSPSAAPDTAAFTPSLGHSKYLLPSLHLHYGSSFRSPLRAERFCVSRCPPMRCCYSSPDRTSALATLSTYLRERGILLHDCQLCPSASPEHKSRGVTAISPISPSSVVMTVPISAALTSIPSSPPKADWWLDLVLLLLRERALGPTSLHYPYIFSLPEDPPGALWACERIGFSAVATRARAWGMSAELRRIRAHLRKTHTSVGGNAVAQWRDFVWAFCAVQSRAFRVDADISETESNSAHGRYALLPGVDMLNHSVRAPSYLRIAGSGDAYEVCTACGFGVGAEVLVNYGGQVNDNLALFYGFVEANSPCDAIRVSARLILRVAAPPGDSSILRRAREEVVRREGLLETRLDVRGADMDKGVMAVLRVAVATENELHALEQVGRAEKPVSLENELRCWAFIATACKQWKRRLPEIDPDLRAQAQKKRQNAICSAAWRWDMVGEGKTVEEALWVIEREAILDATEARVEHYAMFSQKIGRVTTVLLPPTQEVLPTFVFNGAEMGERFSTQQ